MSYHVEFVPLVLDHLQGVEGLTDSDRAAIVDGVIEELGKDADRFQALYPLAHESYCFRYDYPHSTTHAVYDFDFVVDAQYAEMSVMSVVYVECTVRII